MGLFSPGCYSPEAGQAGLAIGQGGLLAASVQEVSTEVALVHVQTEIACVHWLESR